MKISNRRYLNAFAQVGSSDELTMTVTNVLLCGKLYSSIVSNRRIFSVSTLLCSNSRDSRTKNPKMTLKMPKVIKLNIRYANTKNVCRGEKLLTLYTIILQSCTLLGLLLVFVCMVLGNAQSR